MLKAKELLQEIYDACHYVTGNLDSLQAECRPCWRAVLLKHVGEDYVDQELFDQEKRRLKAAWKKGTIDQ